VWNPLLIAPARCRFILMSASSQLQWARWLVSCGGCTQPLMPPWLEWGPAPNHNLRAIMSTIPSHTGLYSIPVSYYLKSSHLNMQSSNDDDKIISTWLLYWLKFWDLSWNAILVNVHVALFQGVLTMKNEVWKLKNWSHIFIDSAFINVHQQFC